MIKVNGGNVEICGMADAVLIEYAALTESLFETLGSKTGEAGEEMVKVAYKTGKKSYRNGKSKNEKGEDKNENHIQ